MIRSAMLHVLPAVFLSSWLTAQTGEARGIYHRNEEPAYEVWIPRGLDREKPQSPLADAHTRFNALYRGDARHGYEVMLRSRKVQGSRGLDAFVTAIKLGMEQTCPGVEPTVFRDVEAAGRPAAMVRFTYPAKAADPELAVIHAGVDLEETVVIVSLSYYAACHEAAMKRMRWILSAFRCSGPTGLNPFLLGPSLDKSTGLSYRPPRGFQAESQDPSGGSPWIHRSRHDENGAILTIVQTKGKAPEKALENLVTGFEKAGRTWSFPHDGQGTLLGGVFTRREKPRVRIAVAVALPGAPVFGITVDGPDDKRESLVRTAELVSMGLGFVDVEADRRAVADAARMLEAAQKRRDPSAMNTQLEALARHAYLEEATLAMARMLPTLEDEETKRKVARVLAGSNNPAVLPYLLKAVRVCKSKKQHRALAALLTALGSVRSPRAAAVLLDFARRDENTSAAAAIRALGYYGTSEKRDGIVKSLIRFMQQAERDGTRSPRIELRERWKLLQPAYLDTLKRLTGQTFSSASAARDWLRRPK